MIRFLLNNTPIEIEDCDPSITILDWVRTKIGKTGTKEGCATGDCGACTILVGYVDKNAAGDFQWQYKSINSCLMLLGNANGKHIITIEGLSSQLDTQLDTLHPIQRAIVESHGSQCGFCTPGIIMSLLALYINNETYPGKTATIHALGGNLCRCTGYAPILKAAEKAYEYKRVDEPWSDISILFNSSLQSLDTIPFLTHEKRHFYIPQTLEDLLNLRALHPQGKVVAGATDFAIELSQHLVRPDVLISTTGVPELNTLNQSDEQIEIGAAVPYQAFIETFTSEYPEAQELFDRLGSTQVRNAGTLGGSLGNASPIGDPAPLLIALNATMDLTSISNSTVKTRTIKVEDFFVGYRKTVLKPREIISKITIPNRKPSTKLACHKISKRFEDDISTVCLILAIEENKGIITAVKCAMGGMAEIPARAKQVEQQLIGCKLTLKSFVKAGAAIYQDFTPLSDARSSAEYRLTVSKNLLKRIGVDFCQQETEVNIIPTINLLTRIAHASL